MFPPETQAMINREMLEMSRDVEVQRLKQVLHVLWKEVERLEHSVSVTANEIALKCGDASIVLKKDGTVLIKGREVTIEGSGNVAIKGRGRVMLDGNRVAQS